jgi:hypothetical protein
MDQRRIFAPGGPWGTVARQLGRFDRLTVSTRVHLCFAQIQGSAKQIIQQKG